MKRFTVFAVVLLASTVAAAPTPSGSAAAILARVRAATLSRPLSSIHSVRTAGVLHELGLSVPEWEMDDVEHERFVQRAGGSNMLSGASGYNGTVSWNADRSGVVRIDGGESTHLQNVDLAYMQAYAYLRPNLGGASATFVGERHHQGNAYLIVELTPPGGSAIDLWIDASTYHIAQIHSTIGLVSSTVTLSQYRRVDGIDIPFRSVFQDSQGNGGFSLTTSAAIDVPGVVAAMRVPRNTVHDFSIASATATTIPISIINGHIYLHVRLNGKGPYTFIFDTGGANIVTPEVAAALHARSRGSANLAGVGAATEAGQFTRVRTLEIGAATIRDQDFVVLPIGRGFGVAEGLQIDGMVGPALPDRFLTTIDYARGRMTLSLRGHAKPRGRAVPFFFSQTIPELPVRIDGVVTTADLDTGNRGQLFLTTPFLAEHPAIAAHAKTANAVTGFGVGGPSYGRLGRIAALQIGPFTLRGVVADFGTQHTGATADPFTNANVGGGAWCRFTLTLDYRAQRIYLQPNALYGTPFTYDRSGLFLVDLNGNVVVIGAIAGTPAAAAGLQKGDAILTVDGRPATSYSLAALRALFSGAPGTVFHLHVRSGSQERDVTLTLANYV